MPALANTAAVEETDRKPISGNRLARNEMRFSGRPRNLAVLSIQETSKHPLSIIPMPTFLLLTLAYLDPWGTEPKYHNICTTKILTKETSFVKVTRNFMMSNSFHPQTIFFFLERTIWKYSEIQTYLYAMLFTICRTGNNPLSNNMALVKQTRVH